MRPKCSSFGGRLLSLGQFSLLHRHQSPPPLFVNNATSRVKGVVLTAVLFLRTLHLSLWTLWPRRAGLFATMLVFSCICRWIWERRVRSSATSRSSRWVQGVHWSPFPLWTVDVFNTQPMASRNKKRDSRPPCLTPVFTWRASISWRPQTTLHVIPL